MLQAGKGVPKDLDEAEKYFRLSAEANDSFGQRFLGYLCQIRHKNFKAAIAWYASYTFIIIFFIF
jgi:TPR repeat protein